MPQEPPCSLFGGEIGVHIAEIALCMNAVFLILGKVEQNLSLGQSHLNVADKAINVHLPEGMIGDDSGMGRSLDVVFQFVFHGS